MREVFQNSPAGVTGMLGLYYETIMLPLRNGEVMSGQAVMLHGHIPNKILGLWHLGLYGFPLFWV
jgi:hypothetical protein